MPLTGRGWAVLVVALASYLVGVWFGYLVFRILAGVALGAVLAGVVMTLRRPQVEVRRELYPLRVERGKAALATLRIRNAGHRWQAGVTAHDLATGGYEQVQIRRLGPGGEVVHRYELPTSRRGRVTVGPLVLQLADPLGLALRELSAGSESVLRVQPKRHPARTAVGGRPRHHHDSRTTDNSLRGSIDLRDVRPYIAGDEVRHVHWKATARIGQLMVRDYIDPDQPRLGVLLDTRPGALAKADFEQAVEVVASVAYSAAMVGHRCRLVTSNGLDLVAAGPPAARMLLDALTDVSQSGAGDSRTTEGAADRDLPLLPSSILSGRADGGMFVLVTGRRPSARELGPVAARHRAVTVVAIDTANEDVELPAVPRQRVRWIVATDAVDAIRQWNRDD